MDSTKIAEAMIRDSHGILSRGDKPAADTIQYEFIPTHVMKREEYEQRFGKNPHHEN